MAKKELRMHAVVSPTETVIASAYDKDGKADACTLAFYMVSSHVPPCVTIAINATQKRKTLQSILESGAFVLGFPSIVLRTTPVCGSPGTLTRSGLIRTPAIPWWQICWFTSTRSSAATYSRRLWTALCRGWNIPRRKKRVPQPGTTS